MIDLFNWSTYYLTRKKISYNKDYQLIKIKDFLKRNKNQLQIQDGVLYKRPTIRLYGKGISLRDEVFGKEIGTKSQFYIKEGQFLLSKIDARNGAFGVVPRIADGGIITGNFWTFDVDYSKINPHYLSLLTSTNEFQKLCQTASVGTTNRNYLQEDLFLNFKIPLPTLEVQQLLLDDCTKKINQAKENLEEAERLEKELNVYLLEELNIKFDDKPINKTKGLHFVEYQDTDRWNVEFLKNISSTSNIKKGKFPTVKVRSLLTYLQYGLSLKASTEPKGFPLLRMNNIYEGELVIDKLKYLDIPKKEVENTLLKKGDILFNRTNSKELVGKTAVFDLDGDYTFASYCIRLRFDTSKVNIEYINQLFNSKIGRIQIDQVSRQVLGQANINSQELQEFIFPIPPIEIQEQIIGHIQSLKTRIKSLKNEAESLKNNALSEFERAIFN